MAVGIRHCSREIPAWLKYAASGNVAACLKTDTGLFCLNVSNKIPNVNQRQAMDNLSTLLLYYCKTLYVRVPLISRISRA